MAFINSLSGGFQIDEATTAAERGLISFSRRGAARGWIINTSAERFLRAYMEDFDKKYAAVMTLHDEGLYDDLESALDNIKWRIRGWALPYLDNLAAPAEAG